MLCPSVLNVTLSLPTQAVVPNTGYPVQVTVKVSAVFLEMAYLFNNIKET